MHHHTIVASAAALAVGAGLGILLTPSPRLAPEKLPKPGFLPEGARGVLEKRMERHGTAMNELLAAVVLTDLDAARQRAEAIAADAGLARPLTGDAAELNSQLPEAFFQLQDDLRARARDLAGAAAKRDGKATAEAFGALSRACVSCHLAYLKK